MKILKDIETRADIELLVDSFYQKVQKNQELDHVFNGVAQLDWEKHLPKMYDFWESMVWKNGLYSGNPMKVHKSMHEKIPFTKSMFDNWLRLFNETVDENFDGPHAHEVKTRALSIATMIQIKTIYGK